MNSTTMEMMQIGHPKNKHGDTTTLLEWLLDVRATVQSRRTMETHNNLNGLNVPIGGDFFY